MADISLPWGGFLVLDATGDIAGVTGNAEYIERIVRRALTNAYVAPGAAPRPTSAENFFDTTYGGNLRAYVDANSNSQTAAAIQARLLQQIGLEVALVASNPPVISVQQNGQVLTINTFVPLQSGGILVIPTVELS